METGEELHPLLLRNGPRGTRFNVKPGARPLLLVIALVVTAAIYFFTRVSDEVQVPSSTSLNRLGASDVIDISFSELAISFSNEYGGSLASLEYLPFGPHIIEPYRETTLHLPQNFSEFMSTSFSSWMSVMTPSGRTSEFNGTASIFFVLKDLGWHNITVKGKKSSLPVYFIETRVMSKYVRREIRSLSHADREMVLDAIFLMYNTHPNEMDALRLHRNLTVTAFQNFRTSHHFARSHLMGSAFPDCDGWHDGAAFYVVHAALTLQFERSLQAIYPQTAAPYWDYSLDTYEYGASWANRSVIFHDDWFGASSFSSPPYHIMESGRFAHTPVLTQAHTFSSITNAYGLLRSPWNVFSAPYVTRYKRTHGTVVSEKLPGCKTFHDCFQSNSTSRMNLYMAGATHGDVHLMIGGIWGGYVKDSAQERVEALQERSTRTPATSNKDTDTIGDSLTVDEHLNDGGDGDVEGKTMEQNWEYLRNTLGISRGQTHQLFFISKNLWRSGFVRVPSYCSSDALSNDLCRPSCPTHLWSNRSESDGGPIDGRGVLRATGQMEFLFRLSSKLRIVDDDGSRFELGHEDSSLMTEFFDHLLRALCSFGYVGEMFTSAAPYDPVFWPIHPTSERLFHFRRIISYLGIRHLHEDWGYQHAFNVATDWGTYCNWTNVDSATQSMPVCTRNASVDPHLDVCPSHRADAPLGGYHCVGVCEYEDLKDAGPSSYFTNAEFYDYTSPFNENLPYMYDSFEWPHCDESGYPIAT